MEDINIEELKNKQNELRKQRNELTDNYNKENNKIQQKIDELDIKIHGADKYLNQYIHIKYNNKETDCYMFVKKLDRLFRGIRCNGYGYIIEQDFKTLYIAEDLEETITYNNLESTNIISKEEYINTLNNTFAEFSK